MTPRGGAAPWIAPAALALLTALLLWPAFATGAPWAFADTTSYYRGGAAAWGILLDAMGLRPDAPAPSAAPAGNVPTDLDGGEAMGGATATGIRSVPYSLGVYASIRLAGIWAPVVAMAFATAGLIWLVAGALRPAVRLAIGAGLALLTALPFFVSLLQPDAATVFVVLVPLAIMLRGERQGIWAVAGLLALMAFAALAHYGNLPLAALAMLWLGLWAWRRGRRGLSALCLGPIVAVGVVNAAIGLVAGTGPSLAPGRFPILLARSIEDGPGHAYLTQACPEAEYAFCEVYDEIPADVGAVLWGPDGVARRATDDQLARIGAEELSLLVDIFRYDPWGQIEAFLGNGLRQLVLFGSAQGMPARFRHTPYDLEVDRLEGGAWLPSPPAAAERMLVVLGLAGLLWAVWRPPHPEARGAVAFLAASLILYAFVCGGLSAPVPRYQGRLVWLIPFLAAVLLLPRRADRHGASDGGGARRGAPVA